MPILGSVWASSSSGFDEVVIGAFNPWRSKMGSHTFAMSSVSGSASLGCCGGDILWTFPVSLELVEVINCY